MTSNVTVMSSVWPAARDAKAASDASTDSVVPSSVTPAGRSLTLTTDSTAPSSTSDAPSNKSSVVTSASPSAASATRAAATTGASFAPVTVIVALCETAAPLSLTMSKVITTSCVSPAARASKAASDGSTDRVVPSSVTPSGSVSKFTIVSVSPFASVAPESRSSVMLPSSSGASATSSSSTIGASSSVPVTVMVAVCATTPPFESTTSKLTTIS